MYPTLTVAQPGRNTLYLTLVDPLVVGRECEGLLLPDDKISRQHLRLSVGPLGVVVSDLGSTNGTFIDRVRLEGDALLHPGAELTLGETTIRVEPPPQPPASAQTTTRDVGGTVVATVNRSEAQPKSTPPNPGQPVMPAFPATGSSGPVVRPSTGHGDTRRTSIEEIAASLGGQHVPVPSGSGDDTVTIMFSDIESSTELALSMGDKRWYQMLTWHNELIEQRVAAHAGFIVKNQGDGFMITFNSSRRAIICASEVQQALHRQAVADPANAVRVRIGMHTGEAIRQDSGDLFGRHVIIAARVAASATGAEILVSSIVQQIASARGDLHFGDGRQVELKGVGEQTVYAVLWGAELPTS